MKSLILDCDFDVGDVTDKITSLMSRWSVHRIDISGKNWKIFNYDGEVVFCINLDLDFNDLKTRIKLEDLRLNIIHHIESLRDDTSYTGQLVTEDLID